MIAHVKLTGKAALVCTELFTPDGKAESKYALETTAVLTLKGQQNAVVTDGGWEAGRGKQDLTYIETEKKIYWKKTYIAFKQRGE